MTELSCSSDQCVPQIVQYHCETNTTTLLWQQGNTVLGGITLGETKQLPVEGYNVTVVLKDGGGTSSNITFMADSNNGTTILCVDPSSNPVEAYNCSLIIGKFYFAIIPKFHWC